MNRNTITRKILYLFMCISILTPYNQTNATTKVLENNSFEEVNELNNSGIYLEDFTPAKPKEAVVVANAVYDLDSVQKIATIKALTGQKGSREGKKAKNSLVPNRAGLTKQEIESLILSGASKEDIYWINMLVKETSSAPDQIFNLKKAGNQSWDELEYQLEQDAEYSPPSVEDAVYSDIKTDLDMDRLTVEGSVYQESMLESKLEINSLKTDFTNFDYTVNSAFEALITQQMINQTNKQQLSDRGGTSEVIDPATGALTWKETEISLPGRDGLDLNIGVMYNSNQSFAYMRDSSSYGGIQKYNYWISRYDLGMGWSFQFPSVQLANGYLFYHDGQGAVYRVDFYAGDTLGSYTHLVGYQGKDVQFLQDSGTFNNGQASSTYYLQYADKKREYFASDGRLLGIVDRFGNTIQFEHIDRVTYDGQTNKVISKITDSLGRDIHFNYETNLNTTDTFNGEAITVSVVVNGQETEKVSFRKWRSSLSFNNTPDGYAPYLWTITDQIGEFTAFNYDSSVNAKFHYYMKTLDSYAGYNTYLRLTTVNYPYSTTNYQYELVTRNLGPSGLGEEFRIKARNDVIKNTYNQVYYTYNGDYTGYPTYWDPNIVPESYRFFTRTVLQSSSATNGLATTTNFNGLQQVISTVSEASNGERKEERNEAFHSDFKHLPTRVRYADFGAGDTDSSATTLYSELSYTDWGGIQSQTQPLNLPQLNDSGIKSKYTTTFTYEPNFHLLQSKSWYQNESVPATERYNYNEHGRIIKYISPKNEETNYTYDPVPNDVKKVRVVTEEKPLENGMVSKTVTTYGPETNYGYPTEQISYFTNVSASGQQSSSSVKKQMTYDMGSGNLKTETDGDGKQTSYTYDQLGRILTITYPTITNLNNQQYDVQDQYTYIKDYGSSAFFDTTNQDIYYLRVSSKRKYTQKSNGATTYLSELYEYYDGFGLLRLSQVMGVGGKGQLTQYHVDDLSRAIYVVDPVGNVTTASYNAWGKQNEAFDADGNLYVNEYDLKQRKVTNYLVAAANIGAYRNNPANSTFKSNYVEQTYDQWAQLVNTSTYKDWPSQGQPITEKYSYDIAGNLTAYTDPNNNRNNEGVTVKYGYDILNRLTSVKDALDQVTKYRYDRNGQITETTMQSSENNPAVKLKDKSYNELGLMYNKKDASSLSESQIYNQRGLLEQKTDRNGTTYSYQYDERNQVVNSLLTGSEGNTQQSRSIFGSNGIKNDTNELYINGGKVSWQTVTIDNLKRLNQAASQASGYTASTSYTYDLANRLTRIGGSHTGVGVSYTNYQYNKQRLEKVQIDGKSTANNAASVNAFYEYYATGLVKSITYPALTDGSVLKTEYTYDPLNRISTLKNKKGTVNLSSYSYQYDNNGNITSVTEALNYEASKTTTYAYDKLNRLIQINYLDGAITKYTYTLQGDRLTASDTSLASFMEPASTNYTYDLQNMLTGVTKDSSFTSFNYLPEGLRYKKTTDGLSTQYNYDGNGNVISELKSNGQKAYYIRGDRLLVKKDIASAQDFYYLYNGHGDVVQMVDTSGNVVNSYAYDTWGNIKSQMEGTPNSFKYAGEVYDAETGLYYLRARYYDPSIGRFLNEDTYEGQIDNPLSLNLYTYGHNNPLMFVDPSGHKVVFSQNQYDYLKYLQAEGNTGQQKWANQQLKNGMAYYDTKSKKIVSGSFDSVTEDDSFVYDLVGGIGGAVVKATAKAVAKTVVKEAAKLATKKTTFTLSKSAIKHFEKHTVSSMQKQAQYLTKEQLDNKLKKTSFFNPNWSNEKIISVVQKGYSKARNENITGLYEYKAKGETIKIFIKNDGTFDTAYGAHKLTASYFGK